VDLGIRGRVAVVMAGSRGLGFATAEALAAEGARLVVCARGEASLDAAAAALRERGSDVLTVVADAADPGTPERLVAVALDRFGSVDIAVANAGGPPPGRALELAEDQIAGALQANLLASVRLAAATVPHMRRQRWGRICCITSYTVVQAVPTLALSNLARTGLWAWAKTAAHDLAAEGNGVTLNLVCPGRHATERMVALGSDGAGAGDPADFGKVVAFLCSAPAGFVNGAAIVVDGGETLAL